jgi:tetratricopeptide (TPR) repeat protein
VRGTLSQLGSTYAASAVADVTGNVDEAAARLDFLRDSTGQAQQAVDGGETSRAAVLVQGAQLADDQITQLLDGVDRRAQELSAANAALPSALADTQANIAEAAASNRPGLAEVAARARTVTDQVRNSLAAGPGDPLASLRAVEDVNARLDQALTGAREDQVRQQHARAALEQAVLTAHSSIGAASDFIVTNRGGVGSAARTRAAEAQRHLDRALALANTDAESALAEAQRADLMAQQAYQEAQQDVSRFAGAGPAGGMFGGSGAGLAGAVLGGILIGGVLGGGGRGGRGPMPRAMGSYGGMGTRGRRGVGGRF